MEHAIHLSAKHVAEEIAPTSASKLLKHFKNAVHSQSSLDDLDRELEDILDEEDIDDDLEQDPESLGGDALGLALALAAQVSYIFGVGLHSSKHFFRSRHHLRPQLFLSLCVQM
jgi:hypothetical protein